MRHKKKHQRPFDEELVSELLRERLHKDDPSTQFRDALYGRIMRQQVTRKAGAYLPRSKGHGIFGWISSVAIACLVLLTASGLTTTYAYVSSNVTRQSSLYELKLIVERAELSLSSSPEQQARSLLKFAKRRTDELRTLSFQGKLDTETLAAIVQYTEEALALADKANDTTTQSDIRELVAKEAAAQRATLQELLISLGISSLDGTESMSVESETPTDTETSVVLMNVEDIKAYEQTISKVGSVEVNALEQITNVQLVETERPADLSLTIPIEPVRETTVGRDISFTAVISSTGAHPIDNATVTVDWGDGRQSAKYLANLAKEKEHNLMFTHTYNFPGAFIQRIVVSGPPSITEWTTANNRDSLALTVHALKPLCDLGARRCESDRIGEVCVTAGWQKDRICLSDERCSDGACIPQCVSSCHSEGEQRCNIHGTSTEICERRGTCLEWRTKTVCNERCSYGECLSNVVRCGDGTVSGFEQCDDGNTLSGDGCTASCMRESQCTDDDGGNIPAKQGTVRGRDNIETDFCEDPNTLIEFTCSVTGSPFANRVACPKGCRYGACITGSICGNGLIEPGEQCDDSNKFSYDGCSSSCQIEKSCTDTDGGTEPLVRGSVSLQGQKITDFCAADGKLWEYRCSSPGSITSITYTCATPCQDGACTPLPPAICGNSIVESPEKCDDGNIKNYDGCSNVCLTELVCRDSDGGNLPSTNGYVQFGPSIYSDKCVNMTLVQEYVCLNAYQMSSITQTCPLGCQGGVCLAAPLPVCGNGIIESGEQCDDNNAVAGDGCSATCQTEQAIDLSVRDISYLRLPLTDTTDKITVSIHVMNIGPAYTSARIITATLVSGATDEYPSGFTWTGDATVSLGVNNGVEIQMNGQYVVPRNKPVNFPVTATARFTIPTSDPQITNNTLQTTIISEKALDPCTDTDGGLIYDQKGTISSYVSGNTVTFGLSDVCLKDNNHHPSVNPKMLSETYCDAGGIGRRQNYECQNGCSDGACTAQ